ncbi:hypothetical protein VCCP103710_2523, partial [Vibrio cholerae CP1037(10)]
MPERQHQSTQKLLRRGG